MVVSFVVISHNEIKPNGERERRGHRSVLLITTVCVLATGIRAESLRCRSIPVLTHCELRGISFLMFFVASHTLISLSSASNSSQFPKYAFFQADTVKKEQNQSICNFLYVSSKEKLLSVFIISSH